MIVIDAVNQLNAFYGAHSMDWLPTVLPRGVKVILSTTPASPCYQALVSRDPHPYQLEVPDLKDAEKADIVISNLAMYRKKLTEPQLESLLHKAESYKPLYLLTSCEELRLQVGVTLAALVNHTLTHSTLCQAQYGSAGEGVTNMIEILPEHTADLMDVVLQRVERDMSAWTVAAKFSSVPTPDPSGDDDALPAGVAKKVRFGGVSVRLVSPRENSRAGVDEGDAAGDSAAGGDAGDGGEDAANTPSGDSEDDQEQADKEEAAQRAYGRWLVANALTLLRCSRHGLKEQELLTMLAPQGKKQLLPAVWARYSTHPKECMQ